MAVEIYYRELYKYSIEEHTSKYYTCGLIIWIDCLLKYHIILDYPEFSLPPLDMQIKQEPEDENKYNPEDANGDDYY